MSSTAFINGASALVDRFDGFILDQWGVLHNGREPYPGVLEALRQLKDAGKSIALLSNSGRRADFSRAHLAELGFDLDMFEAIVTSGETTFEVVEARDMPPLDRLGKRCYLITRDGDRSVLSGTDTVLVEDVEDADFILLSGVDSPMLTEEDYYPALEEGAKRGVLAICSNPDLYAPTDVGLVFAPGLLAVKYEELGGQVFYVGKPHEPVYRACLRALAAIDRSRIIGIGDSLDHDVKGAAGMGLASGFVLNGLHQEAFAAAGAQEAGLKTALDALCRNHAIWPDFALPAFRW
ncbi:TIGR01459 family HAD-type hydrolase [Arboricoccus pini]|nr:TIGR01459 family HAD-type hydrolase [Arboricoccus pini]